MHHSRFRILGPFLAALAILGMSILAAWMYFQGGTAGLNGLIKDGLKTTTARTFISHISVTEIIPIYLGIGLLVWLVSLAVGSLFVRSWFKAWTLKDSFGITFAGLFWVHALLWWMVPTTLWVIPGIRAVPFIVGITMLLGLPLALLIWRTVSRWQGRAWLIVPGWLFGWSVIAYAPLALGRRTTKRPHGNRPVQVLLLGVDGLRPEDADLQMGAWSGTNYPYAYSMVPATRLFYSLLWGGDPSQFSIGHVLPSEDEFRGKLRYKLLESYKKLGLKSRFYIDDGGTIGLAGRTEPFFDDTAMPAPGWENFVNSNLAVHLPLYASWLDVIRVFPATTPWSSVDSGLKEALERGRGADLVMFHTCHLHQPIFLSRKELNEIPRWWSMKPIDLRPIPGLPLVTSRDEEHYDSRRDPLLTYRIRVRHLMASWHTVWEHLTSDPDYSTATRVLFADHGERFYHATPDLQLQGTHGFDLDPWELRVPFLVSGPGFPNGQGTNQTVGMLELRDVIADKLIRKKSIRPESFGNRPFAVSRYHTLKTDFLRPDPEGISYMSLDPKTIIGDTKLFPGGVWMMNYQASLEDRQKAVSLARAVGDQLEVFKPLEGGGAYHLSYKGFMLEKTELIDETDFNKAKREIEQEFMRPIQPGTTRAVARP